MQLIKDIEKTIHNDMKQYVDIKQNHNSIDKSKNDLDINLNLGVTKEKINFSYTKSTLGFIIIYGIVIIAIPYLIFNYGSKPMFLTVFANVDLISNILSINFPSYFKEAYNYDPSGATQNISYNIISLVALSGIFIHGLSKKNDKSSDLTVFISMVIMSIITWASPTQLVPYIVNKITEIFKINREKEKDVVILITTGISLLFILIEGILIHLFLRYEHLLPHSNSLKTFKFKF